MGVEVNPGHRNNPVKEFFHNPKVQAVLKVTAVALAALAVLAGVVALAVFIAPAFAAFALPMAALGIFFTVLAGKKSAEVVKAQRGLEDARQVYQRTREQSELKVQDSNRKLQESIKNNFRSIISTFEPAYRELNFDKASEFGFATQVFNVATTINSIENYIIVQNEIGANIDLSSIAEFNQLIKTLYELFGKIKVIKEDVDSKVQVSLTELQVTIDNFLLRFVEEHYGFPESDLKTADRPIWHVEYRDLLIEFNERNIALNKALEDPLNVDLAVRIRVNSSLKKIAELIEKHTADGNQLELSEVQLHENFCTSLKALEKRMTEICALPDLGPGQKVVYESLLKAIAECIKKCIPEEIVSD